MAQISLQEFENLYRQNYRHVKRLVFKHGYRNQQADDLIQEAFITAWEKQSTLDRIGAFKSWILTIARNKCLLKFRSQKAKPSLSSTHEHEYRFTESSYEDDTPCGSMLLEPDNMAESLQRELSLIHLTGIIRKHKPEPRGTIARLFYLEDMSVKDISQELSLKQNTVLSHLRRFRIEISEVVLQHAEKEGYFAS